MAHPTLLVERDGALLTVTVNRPDKLNALSEVVLGELRRLLLDLAADPGPIRGMRLAGAGERAFVAGADIAGQAAMSPEEGEAFGRLGQEVAGLLGAVPFPVIACVHGYALGGGCELAMGCDFIYATTQAVFGQPEVNLGLIPGFGGCVRLLGLVGPGRARELIYTGRNVAADEAARIGLVNRTFATRDEMMRGAAETLALVASRSRVAVALCKEVLAALPGQPMPEQLAVERAGFRRAFESEDMREGVAAFLGKRPPAFPGR